MKVAGLIRNIDRNGRIVFPSELRKVLNMNEGDPVEIFADNEFIHIRKYKPSCIFCGEMKDVGDYKGRNVCPKCQSGIQNIRTVQKRIVAL